HYRGKHCEHRPAAARKALKDGKKDSKSITLAKRIYPPGICPHVRAYRCIPSGREFDGDGRDRDGERKAAWRSAVDPAIPTPHPFHLFEPADDFFDLCI